MDLYYCICLFLFVYLKCRVESVHSSSKRLLQNSIGDLCSVWDAVNNMITLQHTQIKASFEQVHMSLDMCSKKPYTGGCLEWFQGML